MEFLIIECAVTPEDYLEVAPKLDKVGELNIRVESLSKDVFLSKEDVERLYNHLGKILNK